MASWGCDRCGWAMEGDSGARPRRAGEGQPPGADSRCVVCLKERHAPGDPPPHMRPAMPTASSCASPLAVRHGPPPLELAPVRPVERDVRRGATVEAGEGGGVVFCVWALNARWVGVMGDWNDWHPRAHLLPCHADALFKGHVQEARPEHRYLLAVGFDDNHDLFFPRNDPYGVVLSSAPSPFPFLANQVPGPLRFSSPNDFCPPDASALVMCEVHVATASPQGTWQGLRERIPSFKELGVNCLCVMPHTQDLHESCWGYDPVSLFCPHEPFGTRQDVAECVECAHAHGIAVVFDFVPNHIASRSVLDGWGAGAYFHADGWRTHTQYGPRVDLTNPEARQWLTEALRMWLRDFRFDGVRVDSVKTLRRLRADGKDNKDLAEAWSLLQEWSDLMRAEFPRCLFIAEDLDGSHLINSCAGFDAQWDPGFFHVVYQVCVAPQDKHRSLERLANAVKHTYTGKCSDRVIFVESHDTIPRNRQNRLPAAIHHTRALWSRLHPTPSRQASNGPHHKADAPSSPPPQSGVGSPHARSAMLSTGMALGLLFTSPGIPMLVQGQEYLEMRSDNFPVPPMVDEHGREGEVGARMFRLCQRLIACRLGGNGTTVGLTGDHVHVSHMNRPVSVLAFHRWRRGGRGDDTVVLANLSTTHSFPHYTIGVPRAGAWVVRVDTAKAVEGVEGSVCFQAEPGEYDGFPFKLHVHQLLPSSVMVLSMDPVQ